MKKLLTIFTIAAVTFSLSCMCGHAQNSIPLSPALQALNPINIFPVNPENEFVFRDNSKGIQPSTFEAKAQSNASPFFTAEVFSSSKSHTDVQTTWKNNGPVKRGDVLLARFAIRFI